MFTSEFYNKLQPLDLGINNSNHFFFPEGGNCWTAIHNAPPPSSLQKKYKEGVPLHMKERMVEHDEYNIKK